MCTAEIDHVDLSFKALCASNTDCDCDLTIEDIEDIVFKSDISIGDGFKFSSKIMETFKQQGINLQETAKECIKTNLQYKLFGGVFESYIQQGLDDNNLEFFEKST